MTEVKESRDSFLLVLNDLITSDEKQHGQEPDDVVLDGLPPSLLRYFETSKTRAVVCEKLLLEEAEGFTASHCVESLIKSQTEICESEQFPSESENEDNKTAHDYIESEEINKCDAEHERHHRGEAKKEEQRRQRDTNFQEELNEIIETKKLHQMELQLKEKIVQDRLQQEMLIQQEIISDLQNRVQRERRMIEEEQRRQKEEEERKVKMKEEKRKKEEEDKSKRMEEEGERKPDLGGLKKEWRERQEDKRRKSKVEQNRREDVNQKMEEEMRREVQEDERKTKEVGEVLCNQTKGSRGDREAKREKEKKQEAENKNKSQEMKIQGQLRGTEKETEKQEQQNEDEKDKAERMKMDEGDGIKKKDDIIQLKACEVKWKDEERQSVRGKDVMRKEEIRRGRVENEDRNTKEEIKVKVKTETSEDSREMKYERQTGDGEKKTEALKLREKDVLQKKDGTKKLQMEIMLNVEEVKHDEETMRGEMRLTEYNEKEKRMIKKQLHKAHFMKLQIKNQDSTECWSHSNTGPSVSEVTVTRSELVPSVSEVTVTRSELVPSVSEVTVTRSELVPSVSEVTVTRSELVPSVSEVTVTRSELVPSVSEVTVTRSELVPSVSEVTVTRSELVPSVSEVTVTRSELVPSVSEVTVTRSELVPSVSEVTVTRSELVPSVSEVTVTRSELVPSVSDALKTCSELGISVSETMVSLSSSETPHLSDKRLFYSSGYKTLDQPDLAEKPSTFSWSSSACLPALTEQKRLSWMRDCVPWTKLSFLNRRKLKDLAPSRRGPRKPAETCRRTPLSPIALLQSSGCRNLQEVTTVTLENLPECSLSTLLQCCGLRSLTLRHCGLRSLEGINQLQQLCYIDVQENDISFVDCENMTSLRVLQLAHNKLTSIHGLTGAENVDVLDLSHNSITRIAGLESLRRLQRLSMDHNQLISTKGLRDVYTLLHLNCSHNHLARVEGLENSALLHSLDLRANSLTEPPSLNNQVLLRELRLDDNNISSLNGLADCWLPLLHRLSATQNRLTQLPHMTDFVSLENLDLRFNYLSEIQNVCENLEGCPFLQEVHLSGNPLQQESGWRSLLQKSVHALKATENQQPGSFLSSVSLDPGSFLAFCQAQLQQTRDLQQCHSRELSEASCSLHTLESFLRQLALTLKLAEDQRVAHEYGEAAAQFTPGSMLDMDGLTLEVDYTDVLSWGDVRVSRYQHKESPTEDGVTADPRTGRSTPDNSYKVPGSSYQDSDLKNTAAVMIQQQWKKYRQKCGNINDTRQDRKKPELRASSIHSRTADEDYAATVIQAFWRGSSLRRRLASALTAATSLDTGEDDTFEEVDVEEFVFDEPALEKHWTLTLPEDSFPRHLPESPKPPVSGHNHSQHKPPPPLFLGSPKQAWIAEQPVDVAAQISSPEICNYRSKSPASTSGLRGLSERSEKILEEWGFTDSRTALLMLKRAQKMKSTKQQRKHGNSSVHPALFRNCNNQPGPADARNRLLRHQQCLKAGAKAEQGLQRTKMIRREGAQTRAVGSDGRSESKRFLPEMNPSILSGGRVLLVAYTSCSDCPETAGPWDSSGLVSQHGQASVRSCRNSWGHLRQEVLPPERVASAPSKNKRISFRDNPVQLSGGWGGGRKRDTWHK